MAYDQNLADRLRDELDAQRAQYEELNMMGVRWHCWRSINGSN
jgi:hypothetical protein